MTICIGCGCDDHHVCEDGLSAGCHWFTLDTATGLGVCSACPELLVHWNAGLRDPLPEFTELRCVQLLADIYDAGEARAWFQSRQKLLGFKQPSALVATGNIRRVREAIDQLRDGVYL